MIAIPVSVLDSSLMRALRRGPDARANLFGGPDAPRLRGTVRFYQTDRGVFVLAEVFGLPAGRQRCQSNIFAFHIHSGGSCAGTPDAPFSAAQGHYNPGDCPHPAHAGDMPPLFANGGYAAQVFLTGRFTVREILGKTVIIHDHVDDFTSQPAGNAGTRIACGVIRRCGRRA